MKHVKGILIAAAVTAAGLGLLACGKHTHGYAYKVTVLPTTESAGTATGVCQNSGCDRQTVEAELPAIDATYAQLNGSDIDTDAGYAFTHIENGDYTVGYKVDGKDVDFSAIVLKAPRAFSGNAFGAVVFLDASAEVTYTVAAFDDSGYRTDVFIGDTAGHKSVGAQSFVLDVTTSDAFTLAAARDISVGGGYASVGAGDVLAIEIPKAAKYVFEKSGTAPFDFDKLGVGAGIKPAAAAGLEVTGEVSSTDAEGTTYELAAGTYYVLVGDISAAGSIKIVEYKDPRADYAPIALGTKVDVASASYAKPGKYYVDIAKAGYYAFESDNIDYAEFAVGDDFTKGYGGGMELNRIFTYRWTKNVYYLEEGRYYIVVAAKGSFKLGETTQPPDEDPDADKFVDFTGFTAEQQGTYAFTTSYTIGADPKVWTVSGTITINADNTVSYANNGGDEIDFIDIYLTTKNIYIAKIDPKNGKSEHTGIRFVFETNGNITVQNDACVPNSKGYTGVKS